MNVTQLTPQSAQIAHKELLESLGSENNPQQWMIFMEAVDKHIPEMSSKGRLSAQTIERSLIGQLGFKSWKEYVESPLKTGGLNWSIGGWNSFRRAWTTVKDYPFLRQEEIKAGWLNAFTNDLKKNEIDFPKTKRELEDIQNQKAVRKTENKNSQLNEANEKIASLNEELKAVKSKNRNSIIKNKELSAQVEILTSTIDQHITKIEHQANRISELKAKPKPKLRKIGRFEALQILFYGD